MSKSASPDPAKPIDVHLSDGEKLAIQRYMLTLLALPAAVVALISSALGFAVNQWATNAAYTDAFKLYLPQLLDLTRIASSQSTKIDTALSAVNDASIRAAAAAATAEKNQKAVQEMLSGSSESIAKLLLQDLNFKNHVASGANADFAALKPALDKLTGRADTQDKSIQSLQNLSLLSSGYFEGTKSSAVISNGPVTVTITKTGDAVYRLTFSPAQTRPPILVATARNTSNSEGVAILTGIDGQTANLQVRKFDGGSPTNAGFYYVLLPGS